ncbi:hypothetical protein AMQ83_10805 [Paenibacillus riograndensis]|nr:hypothetical protein AMQ83_10805 [Paenibacillus riograndensis]
MNGYFNDEQLTQDKYRYNKELKELELFTGDLFKMDEQGYLYFISRTQFFIKRRGQRISPLFIEDKINEIACVIDCVVIPVRSSAKDLIVGFIRVKKEVTYEQAAAAINKTLPDIYKLDYLFLYEDNFPYSSNGKIDRKALIRKAESELPEKLFE